MRHSGLWILGLCGAIALGAGGVVAGCGSGGGKKGDLTVVGEPKGELEGPVRIVVTFSRNMVPSDKIAQAAVAPPLKVSPDVGGEAVWANEKTLVVTSKKILPVSTRFTATVPKSARSLDGAVLGEDVSFEFWSQRLTGDIEVLGSDRHATKDQLVKISFNNDVAFSQVEKHCSFSAKDKKLGVKAAPDSSTDTARTFTVQPKGELTMDTEWALTCAAELRGAVGDLGPVAAVEKKFRTYGAMKFVSMAPKGDDIVPDEGLAIELAFSNPPKAPYQMKISPEVVGFPQRCYASGGDDGPGISCAVPLEARTSYTITIAAEQEDIFGQKLGAPSELSFRTSDAQPTISLESGYFIAELRRPVLPLWTRNVGEIGLRIIDVTPANFHQLSPKLNWWETTPADFKDTKLAVKEQVVKIGGEKNKWGQRPIDPAELLGKKAGPGMYYVEVASEEVERGSYADGGCQKILVNFTDLGVVSKISPTRGVVWVTQLSTGKPLAGAAISVRDASGKVTWTGTSGADGTAILPGSSKLAKARSAEASEESEEEESYDEDSMRIFVQNGADFTMVSPNRSGGLSPWAFNVSVDRDSATTKLRGFMHTDRGLYRAGEKVHVKGLARVTRLGEQLSMPGTGKKVAVTVEGPQGGTAFEVEAKLSAFGGFWFDLDLPEDARLGDYTIRAQLEHGTFTREFSVEAYRVATFEVNGKAKETRVVRQGKVSATIAANYFYGAPLRSGEVDVAVHSRPRRVEFPGFEGFQFWDDRRYQSYYYGASDDSQTLVTEDHLTLDDKGNANLAIDISPSSMYSDADLLVRANVTAPSNEVISKTFTIPYFHSKAYYGIKSPGYFLDVGKPAKFEIVGVSPDGKAISGTVKVTVTRRDWNCVWEDWGYRGSYRCANDNKVVIDKPIQLVAGTPAIVEITPESGGDYLIVVEGDKDTAPAANQVYAWGDGGGSWQSSDSMTFDVIADKKEYKAGDTATLILKTDLTQATGLVSIERDGVIEHRLIEVTPKQKHLSVPLTAAHAPNVYVSVALVQGRIGDGERGKPRMRMGVVNLPVRPEDSTLTVAVTTDKADYRPGGAVVATVKVTDKAGNPVAAEVSLTAADEGVLSLIGFATPNPVPTFYAPWGLGVTSATQLEFLRDIPAPNLERPATGGDAPGTVRSRFVSTAVWQPAAITDASGLATVKFNAPDNLTAFRVMAVAADAGYRFGSGDKRFTVSKPLQLHQALPRFLSLGDELRGGVIVHNETGKAGKATVKLVTDSLLKAGGALEQTVDLAKGARTPVLFDLTAVALGQTQLKFSVTMDGESDAVILKLPVQHPSPVLSHHVEHGVTSAAKSIALTLPPDAVTGSAELVVSIDPDGLSGIDQGLDELIRYPYGCLEQTTSKVIPMIAVRELAESLSIEGLTGDRLEGFVKAGLAKIGRHQTTYGGFSLWPGGEPEAYYTAYALWGLYLAKQAGYAVDQTRIDDGLAYLRRVGDEPGEPDPYENETGIAGSAAFSLYVRAVLGDKDPQAATTLLGKPEMPIYGKAFLARALAAGTSAKDPAVQKLVGELASIAEVAANTDVLIAEDKDFYGYMSSSLRTSAIVLGALVELDPKNRAIKPLVRVIMKNRRAMNYFDTQQNLYSLLSLTSYARAQSGKPPSVTVALGDQELASGALSGKQRMRILTVPLAAAGQLSITPSGEVNYNVDIRHRKTPQSLKPASNGIVLTREYLDDAGKPKTTFQVGETVVVRIKTELSSDDEHLIVSEPLPAGFEALNTRLATTGEAGVKESQSWSTYREMLDDKVNFASTWTYKGGYVYEFTMRATSVGKFARPPSVAEMMYDPAVNARGGFDVIEIKAK
jgi:alpha-2-macroglobulin